MDPNNDYAVGVLSTASSRDSELVRRLTGLINDIYAEAEHGLWQKGATRTNAAELTDLIASGQIIVATAADGQIVGSVRIRAVSDEASEFGMLVSASDQRGTGIGRQLVDFAERHAVDRGLNSMQLELLVPRLWQHPTKEFLKSWYARNGYRLIGTRRVDDAYPHFAELLATPCDIEVHEKSLHAHHSYDGGP